LAKLRTCAATFAGRVTLCRTGLLAVLITPWCTKLVHRLKCAGACARGHGVNFFSTPAFSRLYAPAEAGATTDLSWKNCDRRTVIDVIEVL
jgi:hypothetical protein